MTLIVPTGVAKIINKAGGINSAQQRLITGITALALQPMFDLNNKKADEDTRVIAASKSIAKGIACPTSGVTIRALFLHFADAICDNPKSPLNPINMVKEHNIEKYVKLMPDAFLRKDGKWVPKPEYMKKYSSSVGNVLAVAVMIFTNFLFDAPVTKQLTNYFYKKITGKDAKQ